MKSLMINSSSPEDPDRIDAPGVEDVPSYWQSIYPRTSVRKRNGGFKRVTYLDHGLIEGETLDKLSKVDGYELHLNVSRSRVERFAEINSSGFYWRQIADHAQDSFRIVLAKRKLTSLTIGLVGSFFILIASAVVIGLVGVAKGSTGLTESSLYVIAASFLVGIFASERIESEFRDNRG